MNNSMEVKPLPAKGMPADYYERNGWLDTELRSLHEVAVSCLDTQYDPDDALSVLHAAGRLYHAAIVSIIFRFLDDGGAPSMSEIAHGLNQLVIPKRKARTKWLAANVRKLLLRMGCLNDLLAYRTTDREAFVSWMRDGASGKVRWCAAPAHIADDH